MHAQRRASVPQLLWVKRSNGCEFKRKVTLRALNHPPIRHNARTAHCARDRSHLNFALPPDHVAKEWRGTVLRHGRSGLLVPGWIPDLKSLNYCVVENGRIKHELSGFDPIFFGLELRGIEREFRFQLLERFHITSRPFARSIYGITLVNWTNWDPVIVVGRHMFWGSSSVS